MVCDSRGGASDTTASLRDLCGRGFTGPTHSQGGVTASSSPQAAPRNQRNEPAGRAVGWGGGRWREVCASSTLQKDTPHTRTHTVHSVQLSLAERQDVKKTPPVGHEVDQSHSVDAGGRPAPLGLVVFCRRRSTVSKSAQTTGRSRRTHVSVWQAAIRRLRRFESVLNLTICDFAASDNLVHSFHSSISICPALSV